MANTSARTLRLLSLPETRRYWPGAELAARLQVSPRTLRRDIDRLRELGYPILAQRGVDGGYQLAAGTAARRSTQPTCCMRRPGGGSGNQRRSSPARSDSPSAHRAGIERPGPRRGRRASMG